MITIADVAQRAGVSRPPVSHTLSGKRPVSEETRRKVEQAVQDLGFRPNILAQSLRMQRSQTVALIIPDITLADVLDWETAQYERGSVLMHT